MSVSVPADVLQQVIGFVDTVHAEHVNLEKVYYSQSPSAKGKQPIEVTSDEVKAYATRLRKLLLRQEKKNEQPNITQLQAVFLNIHASRLHIGNLKVRLEKCLSHVSTSEADNRVVSEERSEEEALDQIGAEGEEKKTGKEEQLGRSSEGTEITTGERTSELPSRADSPVSDVERSVQSSPVGTAAVPVRRSSRLKKN